MNQIHLHKINKLLENTESFAAIVQVVETLRGPDGCPWDKEQTHTSLTQYIIEEAFELTESIETHSDEFIKEELGDVLFQVILHSQLAKERGAFDINDVIVALVNKMIRRHPHVFNSDKVTSAQEVIHQWELIKKTEKNNSLKSNYFNLPPHLPALQTAFKIGKVTEKTKFDWPQLDQVFAKIFEEIEEIKVEINSQNQELIEEELGDLLFCVSQLARHLNAEPETCLRRANKKFQIRYSKMLDLAKTKGLDFTMLNLEEKESLWKQIKASH